MTEKQWNELREDAVYYEELAKDTPSPSGKSDKINSGFELAGGFFLMLSIFQVLNDKTVAGVNPIHVGFFVLWGYWNLYYYRSIKQPWSFVASILITVMNTIWLGLLLYYR